MGILSKIKAATPSVLTLGAVCCGATAVRLAFMGREDLSIWFLLFAGILDGLDGHVARLLHASSEIGAELDSLCDLVDFGLAPGLILYAWASRLPIVEGSYWSNEVLWACALIDFSACAYRLARFNLDDRLKKTAKTSKDPSTSKSQGGRHITRAKFFKGVPAPAACGLAVGPILVCQEFGVAAAESFVDLRMVSGIILLIVAALMVSRIPTLSSKMLMKDPTKESHLHSRSYVSLIVKTLALVFAVYEIYMNTWKSFIISYIFYVISLPLGVVVYAALSE